MKLRIEPTRYIIYCLVPPCCPNSWGRLAALVGRLPLSQQRAIFEGEAGGLFGDVNKQCRAGKDGSNDQSEFSISCPSSLMSEVARATGDRSHRRRAGPSSGQTTSANHPRQKGPLRTAPTLGQQHLQSYLARRLVGTRRVIY